MVEITFTANGDGGLSELSSGKIGVPKFPQFSYNYSPENILRIF